MKIGNKDIIVSLANGRVINPNIPVDGLLCYLDARGKTNTDKHRGTLLDLSGNGDHGTLHNFSFTDESGYVKDLSCGLQFDGVDDILSYSHNLKETDPRTIFIDFELEQSAGEQGEFIHLPFGLYIHNANDFIYNQDRTSYFYPVGHTMAKGTHKFVVTIESTVETGKMYYKGNVYANEPQGSIGRYHKDPKVMSMKGKRKLNRAMLYNRVLTEQEIQQLMEG